MSADDAARRLRLFLSEPFEAGRHNRRIGKIRDIEKTIPAGPVPAPHREAPMSFLEETDPEIHDIIRKETERQARTLELIAAATLLAVLAGLPLDPLWARLAARPLVEATLDAGLQTWLTGLLYDAVTGWHDLGAVNAAAMPAA